MTDCRPLPPVAELTKQAEISTQATLKALTDKANQVPVLRGKVMGFDSASLEKTLKDGTADVSEFEDWTLVLFDDFRKETVAAFIFQADDAPGTSVSSKRALRFNNVIARFAAQFPQLGTLVVPPPDTPQ